MLLFQRVNKSVAPVNLPDGFYHRVALNKRFIALGVLLFVISGCASKPVPSMPTMEEVAAQQTHQLNIINRTDEVINAIQFKPCGQKTSDYSTLINNLKPKQRVVFNLVDACIDIKALNSFDQTLAERTNLQLSTISVWDIQASPATAVKKTQ